jgi:ATP-dependent helicase/nuclease subunit A
MAFNPDPEQRIAIETIETSVVLTAGAGCGKTGTLSGKFIAAIESGIAPGQIAVLTFTNKAAAELRERIRSACFEKAAENSDGAIDWKLVAFCIDGVVISTYHSFYEQLCREYAEELGLDPEFRLLDERIAQGLLIQSARTAVRHRLATGDETIIEFAARHRLESLVTELCQLSAKIEEARLSDLSRMISEELFNKWKDLARIEVEVAFNQYINILGEMTHTNRDGLNKNQQEKIAILEDLLTNYDENQPVQFIENVHETIGKLRPSSDIFKELLDQYKQISASESFKLLMADSELLQLAATETTLLAALALDTKEFYQQAKKARLAVDFDDLMELAERLTQMSFTGARNINNRFRTLLVDEFQDTDSRQARILINLCGELFDKGRLFVVGDSRQAIYRFRGARPEGLEELKNRMPEEGRQNLVRNYRSRNQILRFVNKIAARIYPNLPQLEPGIQNAFALDESSPAVTFHWMIVEKDPGNQHEAGEATESNKSIQLEAENLALYIRQLIESETLVGSRKGEMRPIQPGDIVFLSRSRTHWWIYEKALRQVQLVPHLDSSSGLFSRREIRDLLNLLSLVENQSDSLLLAAVLRGPFGAITDESLFQLSQSVAGGALADAFWQADFSDFPQVAAVDADAMDGLRALVRRLSRAKTELPPSRVVEMAIALTAYDQILNATSFNGDQPIHNLEVLLNDARSFDHDPDFGWQAMIRQWSADMVAGELKEAVAEPPRDRIRFLTIHAAKGLQFPVVVLVGSNGKDQVNKSSWTIHPETGLVTKSRSSDTDEYDNSANHIAWQMAESANQEAESSEIDNLLYVAATRAEDLLIISAPFTVRNHHDDLKTTGKLLKRIEMAFDLKLGKPLDHDSGSPIVQVIQNVAQS